MSAFIDTGPWYASVVPDDPRHTDVIAWLRKSNCSHITTDYVVDEALTLLRARGERSRAIALGRHLMDLAGVRIHFISEAEILRLGTCFVTIQTATGASLIAPARSLLKTFTSNKC